MGELQAKNGSYKSWAVEWELHKLADRNMRGLTYIFSVQDSLQEISPGLKCLCQVMSTVVTNKKDLLQYPESPSGRYLRGRQENSFQIHILPNLTWELYSSFLLRLLFPLLSPSMLILIASCKVK